MNVRAKTFNPLGKKTQKSYDKCQKHSQPNEEHPDSTKAAKFRAEQTMSAEDIVQETTGRDVTGAASVKKFNETAKKN